MISRRRLDAHLARDCAFFRFFLTPDKRKPFVGECNEEGNEQVYKPKERGRGGGTTRGWLRNKVAGVPRASRKTERMMTSPTSHAEHLLNR